MIWLIGDDFVTNSVRQYFQSDDSPIQLYMCDNYDVKVFQDNSLAVVDSAAARIYNQVVEAIQKNGLLPKAIVIVLDEAIIKMVNHKDYGISEIYGAIIKNMMVGIHHLVLSHKEALPAKSNKFNYPTILWSLTPLNRNFPENWNTYRRKFNNCLEACSVLYGEMQILRLKKFWDYNDETLIRDRKFTANGYQMLWNSIYSAFQHWDTFMFSKSLKQKQPGKPKHFPAKIQNSRGNNDFIAMEF